MRPAPWKAVLLAVLLCGPAWAQAPEPLPAPVVAVARIIGPDTAEAGDLVVLSAEQSTGVAYAWTLVSKPAKTFLPVDGGVRIVFASGTPAEYVFVLAVGMDDTVAITTHTVRVGKPLPPPDPDPADPDPEPKATAATYVYEKDKTAIPGPVLSALDKINRAQPPDAKKKIIATVFEQDTVDGSGETPQQYRAALAAALEAGLPALVVTAGDTVLRVLKSPRTEAEVLGAIKN